MVQVDTKTQEKGLAKVGPQGIEKALETFSIDKVEPATVKQFICPNATDQELMMFVYTCRQLQLNPFLKQIYLIKYGESKAQTIIDYKQFLKRAHNYPYYRGYTIKEIRKGAELEGAECTIYFTDGREPFSWTAWFKENAKKKADGMLMSTWASQPAFQIRKCAIKQAHEMCFPQIYQDWAGYDAAEWSEVQQLEDQRPKSVAEVKIDAAFYGPEPGAKIENTPGTDTSVNPETTDKGELPLQ